MVDLSKIPLPEGFTRNWIAQLGAIEAEYQAHVYSEAELLADRRAVALAVLEAAAQECDEYSDGIWGLYKNGFGPERANPYFEGKADAADELAGVLRALGKDL